jgi:hypothetical protein
VAVTTATTKSTQARVVEYTVVGPNLDVLKAQQAHSSSDERQEFTSPERLAIVTCDNAAKKMNQRASETGGSTGPVKP